MEDLFEPHQLWLEIREGEDCSLRAPKCRASHLRQTTLGPGKTKRVRPLPSLVYLSYLHHSEPNHAADYVFVDEHNRHKRLKGMRIAQMYSHVVLIRFSDASV